MAGTAVTYKDAAAATRSRSVTTVGGLDIARTIPVDETDTPIPQATSTLQVSANTKLDTLHADVAAVLAKIIAAPATEVTLAAVLAKLSSSTSYSDATRLPVSQLDGLPVSGSLSGAGVLFTQDMLGYESISVQVTNAGTSCTITYETSDDNTNWLSTGGLSVAAVGSSITAATSNAIIALRFGNLLRYFRARLSTYGSGTVSVVGHARKAPASNALPLVTASISGTATVGGQAAHDAAISGSPVRPGARALTANYTAVQTGDVADLVSTLVGALVIKPFSIPEADWSYAAASGGEVGTADVPVKAAAAAGLRNYMTWLTAENVHASVDTEFVVKDGATVIYRGFLKALGVCPVRVSFPSPLKSTAATALNIANITTGSQVYFNCGGYVAP
ncbi:hypothetical protein [Mesorhizobium sp. M0768]|uniref:hypothetical protein n=1 Tax=Mesorhizobium sp. M0768 TaxID=2956996 RepID=UPI00333B7A80